MAKPVRRSSANSDRGATAVEFALLLPLLLLLVFGIVDFGRAINAQITITQAAREGARALALGQSDWRNRTVAAGIGLNLNPNNAPGGNVTDLVDCPASGGALIGDDAKVQVTYSFSFVTPVGAIAGIFGGSGFGSPITLTANGVMPCET
jgi:Flp pilus assembly protein TadG